MTDSGHDRTSLWAQTSISSVVVLLCVSRMYARSRQLHTRGTSSLRKQEPAQRSGIYDPRLQKRLRAGPTTFSCRFAPELSGGFSKIWLWFLLLDRQGSHRVTRNADAGVLRGTRADGVLASPATSVLAPVSSSNWQRLVSTQEMSVSITRKRHKRRIKVTSILSSTFAISRAWSLIKNMTLNR